MAKRRENWFLIDHARPNPYRLVYKLTKFVHRHKVPIRCSAFTFCEDDVPSGLDLGKTKYDGPFSTEEVEDVKVFYGILKLLVVLGPVTTMINMMKGLSVFIDLQMNDAANVLNGAVSGLLVVVIIPLYIWLIRPFVYFYLPTMLKRIGLGIFVLRLAMVSTALIFETEFILKHADIYCDYSAIVITSNFSVDNGNSAYHYYATFFPKCLYSLSLLLFQIAYYEFICSQSPNTMKGFLIGLSFAIKGAFQTLIKILMPIFFQINIPYLSCGLVYYLICISLTAASLLLYVYFARKYQPRKRDEICPVYRYAEEYYSKEDMNNKE